MYNRQPERSKTAGNHVPPVSAGGQAVQFMDQRTAKTIQRKITDYALTGPQAKRVAQLQAFANSSLSNTPIQLATKIHYVTREFNIGNKKEVVGSKMRAYLDPADPKKGSAPGNGVQPLLMTALKNNGYNRMVRGHLLNSNVGGLGIAANLFPITSQANAKHKNNVESWVKKLVTDKKAIDYQVMVNSSFDIKDPRAQFHCLVKEHKSDKELLKETITSNPGKAKKNQGKEGIVENNTPSMKFSKKQMGQGWAEVGRGYVPDHHSASFNATIFADEDTKNNKSNAVQVNDLTKPVNNKNYLTGTISDSLHW